MHDVALKMGSQVFFTIEKTNSFMAIYSSVLSFPLIPPLTNNSKDKYPNDKNQLGI